MNVCGPVQQVLLTEPGEELNLLTVGIASDFPRVLSRLASMLHSYIHGAVNGVAPAAEGLN